jgi:hypothetical protein
MAGAVKEDPISFTLDSEGHILFKAMIDGVEGNFIFDTYEVPGYRYG